MARLLAVGLLTVSLLLGAVAEARYASGARRSGHRLSGDAVSPLEQHQVAEVGHCLNHCVRLPGCVALNFGTISATANCQLLGQRACDGLPLVADAAVNYYDVYDDRQNVTAETKTPFWDDPGCGQDGYCAAECSAESKGEFCTTDAHCSENLKPPGGFQCLNGTCQLSASFWEVRPGLALPRWQPWRIDSHVWTWKKLKPGMCSIDVSIKLGVGAVAHIAPSWVDEHTGTRLMFRFTTTTTDLFYYDSASATFELAMGVNTNGMVNTDTFSSLRVSWCGGNMAIGPASNPTLATAFASVSQPLDFVMVHSSYADSWMTVDSGVADPWLFEEAGTTADAVMTVPSDSYAYHSISPTNEVTVKYDCMAQRDCVVILRGNSQQVLVVCIACWEDTQMGLNYYGEPIQGDTNLFRIGPLLSETVYNTFTVHYSSGKVTVYRNDGKLPIYAATAPHAMPEITMIGIGGCCGAKTVRIARYDPAWRTDTWLTEGSGYSNGDEPEPAPTP
ncbi:hypothetical protein FJT64_001824 [Amphibalanus amphitrite]|uniref:Farnesoic acid O-methyl transferase domain-containing protein n=1 Tax=Amphibalanus amphitrite TaxID=1232801 RepID=A0A6A4XB60_AMPAM|nr:hypothetical protein FJT64_001824 [Amphibalanus amphitrite]